LAAQPDSNHDSMMLIPVRPEWLSIAEIVLMAEGSKQAEWLTRKDRSQSARRIGLRL